jgi:hypothetical protein
LRSNSVYAGGDQDDREPSECVGVNPIPGGLAPLNPYGIFIHHNPLNPATPLANISDPSQITDFDGFVGLTHIQGGGTGTDTMTGNTMTLAFRADMGFSQGKFIGTDGQEHHGTLCFVWLDLYTGPVGSANLPQQIHDYNVHVDRNDVFWMIPVRRDAVEVDFDEAQARLKVRDLEVFDDHDLANSLTDGLGIPSPPIPGVFPVRARVSFDVKWEGAIAMEEIGNTSQQFKGTFLSTGATITWSAQQSGFHFQSDVPPDPKANLVSVLGREKNGVFFT